MRCKEPLASVIDTAFPNLSDFAGNLGFAASDREPDIYGTVVHAEAMERAAAMLATDPDMTEAEVVALAETLLPIRSLDSYGQRLNWDMRDLTPLGLPGR